MKLTIKQLKQIIKEEIIKEGLLKEDKESLGLRKSLFELKAARSKAELDFRSFGKKRAFAGASYEETGQIVYQAIRAMKCSDFEDVLTNAAMSGFQQGSALLNHKDA